MSIKLNNIKSRKSPAIAALLNIIPGLGYLFIGRRKLLGVALIGFSTVSVLSQMMYDSFLYDRFSEEELAIPTSSGLGITYSIAILMLLGLVAAFMYDAYNDAKSFNSKQSKK